MRLPRFTFKHDPAWIWVFTGFPILLGLAAAVIHALLELFDLPGTSR